MLRPLLLLLLEEEEQVWTTEKLIDELEYHIVRIKEGLQQQQQHKNKLLREMAA